MAHTPVDPGTLPAYENVQVLAASVVLDEFPLIRGSREGFERNRRGYQAFETDEQVASGDGRRVVGERTLEVLIRAEDGKTAHERLYDLDQALEAADSLRYDGSTFTLAGSRGITQWAPLATGSDDLRATISYIPSLATGTNEAAQPVLGPL